MHCKKKYFTVLQKQLTAMSPAVFAIKNAVKLDASIVITSTFMTNIAGNIATPLM